MQLFDHSVETFTFDQTEIEVKMNRLDREGWMFLSSVPLAPSNNGYAFRMLFRRPARPNFVAFGEPGVALPTFSHTEDDPIHTDPTNPDGTCKHDYLCAYCNTSLDGDKVLAYGTTINNWMVHSTKLKSQRDRAMRTLYRVAEHKHGLGTLPLQQVVYEDWKKLKEEITVLDNG